MNNDFWASTLEKSELTSRPIMARDATETLLASAINTILSSDIYLNNAKKIGSIISERQGVSNAVDLIEKTRLDRLST